MVLLIELSHLSLTIPIEKQSNLRKKTTSFFNGKRRCQNGSRTDSWLLCNDKISAKDYPDEYGY